MLKIIAFVSGLIVQTNMFASQAQTPEFILDCAANTRCKNATKNDCLFLNKSKVILLSELFIAQDFKAMQQTTASTLLQQHRPLKQNKLVKVSLLKSKTFALEFPVR